MTRVLRILLACLTAVAVVLVTLFASLALFYRTPLGSSLQLVPPIALALLGLVATVGLFWRRLRLATIVFAAAIALELVWWSRIQPSNDRDWQPEVAVLARAEARGNDVTIYNIRNFDYRTETDFTPRYYDKTFDLNKIRSVDLIASYWMGDAIAHMMVSFGFEGDEYVTVSIETRKEKTESYSTVAGFFKEYELYYVVADERDLIRVRTNFRKDPPEDVYIYRTDTSPENARRLFLSYIDAINSLNEHPEFDNTLTTNCTTNIWMHTKVNHATPFDWKILASGYVPLLAYERGRLDTRLPFEEVRRRSHINEAARAANDSPAFSRLVRAGVPAPGSPE